MYLEKLEINGFKSFAHKAVLEFKPGITAVVGPNGSGKSNVADSFRWVLGEQSIKLLRGKKSEDVIFSGSDKKARLGMAEVSLYFNNEKDEAGIGMSEICITRRLYRSGESEYLINKQKARLLDIQMILAKAGVAHTSYSIIGQGMVDAFLLASPQDRKEFFEEASGVKPLQIKRNQSLNKLSLTEDNLATAEIQLNEISPRLNSLTRQVKKLEQRVELEKTLREKQTIFYADSWQEIEKKYADLHEKLVKASSELEAKRAGANELQAALARLTRDSAKSEQLEKLQQNYQLALEEKMRLAEQLAVWRVKAVQQTQKEVRHNKDIPYTTGQELVELIVAIKDLAEKIGDNLLDKDYKLLENNYKKQQELILKISEILSPFNKVKEERAISEQSDVTKDDAVRIDLQNKLHEAEEKVKEVQTAMRQESEKEKEERSQIWDIQQKYQHEQENLNASANTVNELRVEIARLEAHRDDLKQEIIAELGAVEVLHEVKVKIAAEEKQNLLLEINRLKHQLELIGGIDPEVQSEYMEIKTRYEFLTTQTEDLRNSITSLESLILELDATVKKQFELSFKIIDEEFQKYFKILFAGGKAKLTLLREDNSKQLTVNNENGENGDENITDLDKTSEVKKIGERLKDNFYTGVEIEATPPGKKLKSIGMLSGGERAMTSIALICAIIAAHPSPFVILDEVDAALDEANSIRFSDIVEQLSDRSQFIIITHNRATMEKAQVLYGVTMGDEGATTLLSLKLEAAEKYTNR